MRYVTRRLPELSAALMFGVMVLWSRQGAVALTFSLLAAILGGAGVWVAGRQALLLASEGQSAPMSRVAVALVVAFLSATGLILQLQGNKTQSTTAGLFFWAGLSCGIALGAMAASKSQSR